MSLFGGATSLTRSRNLVEFKAGKMNLRGKMVHPDKRKGLVYIHQGNDMLMHFCWKDRSSSGTTPEDDLVIFPDEVEFKKVTQNTSGRVFLLKWKSNARKFFFWMQEPKNDKDDEFCKKVNSFLNNPPTSGFGDEGTATTGAHPLQPLMDRMANGGADGLDANDLGNVLRGMNPYELATLLSSFGGAGGAGLTQDRVSQSTGDSRPNTAPAGTRTTGTAIRSGHLPSRPREGGAGSSASVVPPSTTGRTASGGPKGNAIQMNALTNVLSNLGQISAPEASTPSIDLNDIMTRDNLIPLLSNKDVQEKLRPHLPDGHTLPTTENECRASIESPQIRQAISAFSIALRSGQLGPVLTQFNFPNEVIQAANQGDVQAFAQALEKHYRNAIDRANERKTTDNTMDIN